MPDGSNIHSIWLTGLVPVNSDRKFVLTKELLPLQPKESGAILFCSCKVKVTEEGDVE